jgi:hypothetical protein
VRVSRGSVAPVLVLPFDDESTEFTGELTDVIFVCHTIIVILFHQTMDTKQSTNKLIQLTSIWTPEPGLNLDTIVDRGYRLSIPSEKQLLPPPCSLPPIPFPLHTETSVSSASPPGLPPIDSTLTPSPCQPPRFPLTTICRQLFFKNSNKMIFTH